MFPVLPSWTVLQLGTGLLLVPSEDPRVGGIRFVERVRPLRPIVEIIHEHPKPAGFVSSKLGAVERLTTAEGEYAAFVLQEGYCGDTPVELTYGFVFGDDFYTRIVGAARNPAIFERFRSAVRHIISSERLFLGSPRRRRFFFQPPSGWQGLNLGFETSFFPADYPGNPTSLTVTPALPLNRSLQDSLVKSLLGLDATEAAPELLLRERTQQGLQAEYWRRHTSKPSGLGAAGPKSETPVHVHVAALDDGTYMYALRLITASEDGHKLHRALVQTVEPLPRKQEAESDLGYLDQWAT